MARNINETVDFLPLAVNGVPMRKVCLFYRKEQFLSRVEKALIESVVKAERQINN